PRWCGSVARRPPLPWAPPPHAPAALLGDPVARLLADPGDTRERLTAGCHVPATADEPVGALEQALAATVAAEAADARLRAYEKTGALAGNPRANIRDLVEAAHAAAGIDAHDYELLRRRDALRDQVIRVDDFPFDFGMTGVVYAGPQREAA